MSSREPLRVEYSGLPHQHAFWTDWTDGANIALVGGYGTGKTRALVVKWLLLKYANGGLLDMLVEPTYVMVRDVLMDAIDEVANGEMGLGVEFNKGEHTVVWRNGFRPTLLRSAEEPRRLAGTNLASVGWDEPGLMQREAWNRGSVRVRHPRARVKQNYLTGTPEGINWFARAFNEPISPSKIIRASCWHPSVGDYPKRLMDTFGGSQHLVDAYVRGMFVPLAEGRVYHAFDRMQHVSENGELGYNKHLDLRLTCDFNIHSMRWLVWQLHPGQMQVLDEIALGKSGDVRAAAREFIRRYHPETGDEQPHAGTVIVTGDATGKGKHATGEVAYDQLEVALREVWPNLVMDVPSANPPVLDRVRTVNHHLSGAGGIRVLIHPRCTELVADLEQNTFREGSQDIDKRDAERTHSGDAFGYAVHRYAPLRRPQPISVG
ncbi:MAG: hypothetical protein GF393_05265, partial [Armatimonadia bacterium]|nr:hypothetical protein [Armatimonadia bacterium]